MIDEKELIALIRHHKKEVRCDNKLLNDVYQMAHDHIIVIVELLAEGKISGRCDNGH